MTEKSDVDPVYPYIDNKVKSLKGQITKLRNRVETLEILDLQEQITSLNSRIKQVASLLLELERDVATTRIQQYLHWALWAFGNVAQSVNIQDCERYARELAASAMTEARNSNKPHEVASGFYSRCSEYFKNHGYPDLFQ